MSAHLEEVQPDAAAVARLLRDARRLHDDAPVLAIVLGSGLGGLASIVSDPRAVPYAEIPGFSPSTVAGHAAQLISGFLGGRPVLLIAGRFHVYEGHSAAASAFPVRVAHALGARTLLVTNAAGGLRKSFTPGDLMVITDHVNLMWQNPLTGRVRPGDDRFPDMSSPYDAGLIALLREVARARGVLLHEGVYCALTGPTYETPAEVRMLSGLGVDAVGMSTVPEVIVARACGMGVLGVSCITNLGAGLNGEAVDHDDVLRVTDRAASVLEGLVADFAARL